MCCVAMLLLKVYDSGRIDLASGKVGILLEFNTHVRGYIVDAGFGYP